MRLAILLSALAALAIAVPYPQEDDTPDGPDTASDLLPTITIPAILSTSLNIPITTPAWTRTRSKKPHWEPIPIFTKECKCDVATVRYPCWATDSLQVSACYAKVLNWSHQLNPPRHIKKQCNANVSLQKCNYEEVFSYGCYVAAAGGCPTPTRAVRTFSSLPAPQIICILTSRQCKDIYKPTPRPGPHPCELVPNPPPVITSFPNITTALPTVNFTLPVVPTNITLPVLPTVNVSLPVTLLV
jgi:hypothetical protein